jgi:CO/xanthine dehydrogenase FAD-binding subunit
MTSYSRPTSLQAALDIVADSSCAIIAGGTDFYPAQMARPTRGLVLDITALPGLRAIERTASGWSIPCLATWSDLAAAPLPPCFDALKQAARQVGGVQIQNAGTILGNLCNASPAADGVPCLLALGATVELVSRWGSRVLSLDDFIAGPRKTTLRPDELALKLHIEDRGGVSRFEKLGARAYLVISIAMVAAWLKLDGEMIVEARIAVGACGPRAILLPELALALVGQNCASAEIAPAWIGALAPIDDIRAPAAYRIHAARTLIERAVRGLAMRALAA